MGLELLRLHELRVSDALVVPYLAMQLVEGELGLSRECLQIWQHASMLQESDEHEVDAEAVEALHLVREVTLVPRLQEQGKLDESDVVRAVSAYQL